jgi:hypothetical protein
MAAETQARQPQMGLSFEQVWTMFQETAEQMKESKAEHDRMIAETNQKFQELAESQKEVGQLVKELSKYVGGVNQSLGDMAEGLMASELSEKFAALGLDFEHSTQNYKVKDKKTNRTLAEVDVLLVNGTIAMVVEVKTTMTQGDVDDHETRMDILRNEPNSLFCNRQLYGAMAGVKISPTARKYALEKGFYVIELTGSTIKIDLPEDFTPKTW